MTSGKTKTDITGIILAGGENKRLGSANKAFLKVSGQRIIDQVFAVMRNLFAEIIIVTNKPLDYLDWNATITTDIHKVKSSLTGIHAGLFYTRTDHAFISACDTPFLKEELVKTILTQIEPGLDVVVPATKNGLEPLCAVYSQKCRPAIETSLAQREFTIRRIYDQLRVKKIEEKRLRTSDPELLSFFNVNTRQDLELANQRAHEFGPAHQKGGAVQTKPGITTELPTWTNTSNK